MLTLGVLFDLDQGGCKMWLEVGPFLIISAVEGDTTGADGWFVSWLGLKLHAPMRRVIPVETAIVVYTLTGVEACAVTVGSAEKGVTS